MKTMAVLFSALIPLTLGLILIGYLAYALAAFIVGCSAC